MFTFERKDCLKKKKGGLIRLFPVTDSCELEKIVETVFWWWGDGNLPKKWTKKEGFCESNGLPVGLILNEMHIGRCNLCVCGGASSQTNLCSETTHTTSPYTAFSYLLPVLLRLEFFFFFLLLTTE